MDIPEVDHLDPRTNSVDVDALGDEDLKTWITYPGIAKEDRILINWRGCAADGSAVDVFGNISVGELDDQQRFLLEIRNFQLQALREGTVFYSYQQLDENDEPISIEFKRRFFYVQRPPETSELPAVALLSGAHDLIIDAAQVPSTGVGVVTLPYAAMAQGDVLTLNWRPWFDEDFAGSEVKLEHEVLASEIGMPLSWRLDSNDFVMYFDGFGFLDYSIEYAAGGSSRSPSQRFDIVWEEPVTTPLLEAPVIPGHSGSVLDPDDDAYRDGVWLLADPYAQLALGDALTLYAEGPALTLRPLRTDVTVLDSGRLAFHLDRIWLQSDINRGQHVEFSYQFGRPGAQKRSAALALALQRPLFLPLPNIKDARPQEGDEPHQGTVHPQNLQQGAVVTVPSEAVIDEGEVWVHWEGHGSSGNVVIKHPDGASPRQFTVPRSAIASNLGHRLWVYYSVTKPGQMPQPSEKFDLEVADYETQSYPIVQLDGVENQQLSLKGVPAAGCLCELGPWPFIAQGQWLGMVVEGELKGGGSDQHTIRTRETEVTLDEYYDGIEEYLPRAFLERLALNRAFRVSVEASFDEGKTWRPFRSADVTLIA